MPLTEEEKLKIKEEEEYRVKAKAELKKEEINKDIINPRRGKDVMLIGLGIIGLGILLSIVLSSDWKINGYFAIFVGVAMFIVGKFVNWYHWK